MRIVRLSLRPFVTVYSPVSFFLSLAFFSHLCSFTYVLLLLSLLQRIHLAYVSTDFIDECLFDF